MNRRALISNLSLIIGGSIVGSGTFISGCKPGKKLNIFGVLDNDQQNFLTAVAEVILPKTPNAPGAADVEIGKFMNTIVSDCYTQEEQDAFLAGIPKIDELSDQAFGDDFMDLDVAHRKEVVSQMEDEAKAFNEVLPPGKAPHFYSMIKQLTIWGYLSSEQVGTDVLRHEPIPGRFDGCLPYKTGEKAFI
jgi:hypothetical protein